MLQSILPRLQKVTFVNAHPERLALSDRMGTIFQEMIILLKDAERRGISPNHVTFSMNAQGLRRYQSATERMPEALQLLSKLTITYNPSQNEDVTLGPISN